MKPTDISTASLTELIEAYRAAAARHGDATESSDHRTANAAGEQIGKTYSEIRRRGIEAQRLLLPLLSDGSPGVRMWAAAHALEFSPNQGEPVLEQLVGVGRFLGLSAEMTLREWRAGRLRFQ
jgi:hypothetical protein